MNLCLRHKKISHPTNYFGSALIRIHWFTSRYYNLFECGPFVVKSIIQIEMNFIPERKKRKSSGTKTYSFQLTQYFYSMYAFVYLYVRRWLMRKEC